jgi:hypothetical protein
MTEKKPVPQPNADTRPFWEGCKNRRIMIQRCTSCSTLRHPPGFVCPGCLRAETEWIQAEGTGRVYSFVVYHQAFYPGFEQELPYVVGLVTLDEGPRMMANIVGCDPAALYCDMPVTVSWDERGQFRIPQFRPIQ